MRGLSRDLKGSTLEGILFQQVGERCFLAHTHTHIHIVFPSFCSPIELPPIPNPFYSLSAYQNKNKNKNSSRAEPPTLYKIVAILSTWAWQPTPQDSPIYISWCSEQCLAAFLWAETLRIIPSLTYKRQAILVNDSRDLLPLSTPKTETRDWQICIFRLRAVFPQSSRLHRNLLNIIWIGTKYSALQSPRAPCPLGLGILYNRTTQLAVSVPKAQQSGQSIASTAQEGKGGKENTSG